MSFYIHLNNKISYTGRMFDIVIPLGPNDYNMFNLLIVHNKQNIIGYRNIYIITKKEAFDNIYEKDGLIFVDETSFPFSFDDIHKRGNKTYRAGWYFQQLLKLYAVICIPNVLPRILIIDADTCFVRPTVFEKDNLPYYNLGTEYHIPYFEHMQKVLPELHRVNKSQSGITHHMIFEKKYIEELFEKVSNHHKGKQFYEVFLDCVNPKEYTHSGASEYEIYFNFMRIYHPDEILLRNLVWKNTNTPEFEPNKDYFSAHSYLQKRK